MFFLICLTAIMSVCFGLMFVSGAPRIERLITAAVIFFFFIAFSAGSATAHVKNRQAPLKIKKFFYPLRFLISLVLSVLLILVFNNLDGVLQALLAAFSFIASVTFNIIVFLIEFLDIFFANAFKKRIVEL